MGGPIHNTNSEKKDIARSLSCLWALNRPPQSHNSDSYIGFIPETLLAARCRAFSSVLMSRKQKMCGGGEGSKESWTRKSGGTTHPVVSCLPLIFACSKHMTCQHMAQIQGNCLVLASKNLW